MDTDIFQNEVLARLERIENQARQTNGRVGKLEQWRAYMDGMRAGVGGLWHIVIATIGGLSGLAGIVIAAIALAR